ncbi:putative isomerase YbhE [Lipomyces kononenkoae]|uniref:Isomerase YbhE n=1 Tax=Lipomyces kononenkoae TaxID=34357 RepID=A0ACC3SSR2_LIPKO
MEYKILLSGERADFTVIAFDLGKKRLSLVANHPSPFNVSWVELFSSRGSIDRFIGLSEGLESGLLYSFEIDHSQKTCKITSQQPTLGAPAHFITLHDNSALALGTYLGGSVALYPISITDTDGLLLLNAPRTEFFPKFTYESVEHGPNEGRQRQCHVHQMLEDKKSLLYAPDLGSDRVWILRRDNMKLEVHGCLQCPPGTGPRHAVFTPDETIMYVIGELSHTVTAFDLSNRSAEVIQPIDGFAPNILPPTVHADHQFMMDSAELCLHPTIPNVLYASNRWERHIEQREPHLKNVPEELPPGEDVAIILLSGDGKRVETMKHVRTNVDVIRGMRLSDDGRFVVVLGQEGGGVEVYEISGNRGDVWTLVAGLSEGLESGIKHAVWL